MTKTSNPTIPYQIGKPDTIHTDLLDPIDYAYQGRRDIVIT